MEKDTLFLTGSYPMPFEFNAEVAKVFDDMVSRSVPLYGETIAVLQNLVQRLVSRRVASLSKQNEPGVVVDVGCSTGTTLAAIAPILPEGWTLIGMDPSRAMLNFDPQQKQVQRPQGQGHLHQRRTRL